MISCQQEGSTKYTPKNDVHTASIFDTHLFSFITLTDFICITISVEFQCRIWCQKNFQPTKKYVFTGWGKMSFPLIVNAIKCLYNWFKRVWHRFLLYLYIPFVRWRYSYHLKNDIRVSCYLIHSVIPHIILINIKYRMCLQCVAHIYRYEMFIQQENVMKYQKQAKLAPIIILALLLEILIESVGNSCDK